MAFRHGDCAPAEAFISAIDEEPFCYPNYSDVCCRWPGWAADASTNKLQSVNCIEHKTDMLSGVWLAGFHGLQWATATMHLAPGLHTFQLDYSQSSVPNLPYGNDAALMLQACPRIKLLQTVEFSGSPGG